MYNRMIDMAILVYQGLLYHNMCFQKVDIL